MDNNKHIIGNQILLATFLKLISDDKTNENLENATKEIRSSVLSHISENEYAMEFANKIKWSRKQHKTSDENYVVDISLNEYNSTLNEFTTVLVDYLLKDKNFINNFLSKTKFTLEEYESYLDLIYSIVNAIQRIENKNKESYYHPFDENLMEAYIAYTKKNIFRLDSLEWCYKNLVDGVNISEERVQDFEKLRKEYSEIINRQNR